MKIRKQRKFRRAQSHSNLSTSENLRSLYDPNGSYTGRGNHPYEKPVQDADDL